MTKSILLPAIASLAIAISSNVLAQGTDAPDLTGRAGSDQPVTTYQGNFTTRVDIDVPEFHGLEPRLALQYDSAAKNGMLGFGWHLDGFSQIERASLHYGAPLYDSTDIYLLDGAEVYPCSALATGNPSCATGGTHGTARESYVRIQKDNTANTWEVWAKNGTHLTYRPLRTWTLPNSDSDPVWFNRATQFQWLLSSVSDLHGNTVTYNYWCWNGETQCYPDTISYNGASIKFYWQGSDVIRYATGSGLNYFIRRPRSIDIKVGAERVRAYQLTYEDRFTQNPLGPLHQRLVRVQEFGRDATVDTNTGAVSGGNPLPPTTFSYGEPRGFGGGNSWANNQGTISTATKWIAADFNGDGRVDLAKTPPSSCNFDVEVSDGQRFASQVWNAAGCVSNTNWETGDFNGDGKADLVSYANGTALRVYISTGTTFNFSTWWTGTAAWPTGAKWLIADVNGDGRSDLVKNLRNSTCTIDTQISTGTSFNLVPWTIGPSCTLAATKKYDTADFNGDGKWDLVNRSYVTISGASHVRMYVLRSDGSAFIEKLWADALDSAKSGENWFTADFNGDRKTDLLRIWPSGSSWSITGYYSEGGSFTTTEQVTGVGRVRTSTKIGVGDIDGDGVSDLFMFGKNGTAWSNEVDVFIFPAEFGFQHEIWLINDPDLNSVIVGDFNGDGSSDIAEIQGTTKLTSDVFLGPGARNVLGGITSSLGGTTTVTYTPSSAWPAAASGWPNTNPPFVAQTVSSVVQNDGRGTTSKTDYTYSGGLWNAPERRFLGFASSVVTLPKNGGESQAPTVETSYIQTLGCAGRVAVTKEKDGGGATLRQGDETYADNSVTLPYTCRNSESKTTINDGGGSKIAKVTRTFDVDVNPANNFGNLVQISAHGDLSISGDEVTTSIDYSPNTANYIVNRPVRVQNFAGIGTGGSKLTETQILYDGATAYTTPPVLGDPTQIKGWLNTTGGYVTATAQYDSYGNVATQSDPLGNTTTFIYDPTYHVFPTEIRDALYASDSHHKVTATWDFVCGALLQTQDFNSLPTTNSYDTLCRPTRTDTPGGAFVATSYNLIGNPQTQYIETQGPAADASGSLWSRAYFDGFGRGYHGMAKGPTASQAIEANITFNARGAIATITDPFYTGDTQQTTAITYDALDRPIDARFPDLNHVQQGYGLSTVSNAFERTNFTDELGRVAKAHADAYGRTIRTEETLNGGSVVTLYQWDVLGRLVGLTDNAGNQWSYTFDSLGRRTAATDPDLGTWTYQYDAAGRLTLQTDARGQRTQITYDVLDRPLTKTTLDSVPAVATTFTYDQLRTGYYNVGQLTTASNPAATIQYNYDAEGRPVAQSYLVDSLTYTSMVGYDTGGRALWVQYPDGDTVGSPGNPILYDGAGRVKTIPGTVGSVTYNALGQALLVNRANGTATNYGYSATRGWLTCINTTDAVGTNIQNLVYARDAHGRITGVTSRQAGESWSYGYDDLDRLLSANNGTTTPGAQPCDPGSGTLATSQTFTYDGVGNILTNSLVGSYNYPGQVTQPGPGFGRLLPHTMASAGASSFGYDANGNMTSAAGDASLMTARIDWQASTACNSRTAPTVRGSRRSTAAAPRSISATTSK